MQNRLAVIPGLLVAFLVSCGPPPSRPTFDDDQPDRISAKELYELYRDRPGRANESYAGVFIRIRFPRGHWKTAGKEIEWRNLTTDLRPGVVAIMLDPPRVGPDHEITVVGTCVGVVPGPPLQVRIINAREVSPAAK